ncbi:hypothetical protein ES332_D09G204400v1 [Gossypium tomentosum]|uniref:Uncharacterized protein n=1 Tax=Gossypium tomentosum TaxID=34277 RepID=A0A5D2JJT4_GOSTO|nr:hypothetical protein ES332_D09G204400v1 [Gossypium tomentosum]
MVGWILNFLLPLLVSIINFGRALLRLQMFTQDKASESQNEMSESKSCGHFLRFCCCCCAAFKIHF